MIKATGTTYSTVLASLDRSQAALEKAMDGMTKDPVRSYVNYRSAMTQHEASLIVLRQVFEVDRMVTRMHANSNNGQKIDVMA